MKAKEYAAKVINAETKEEIEQAVIDCGRGFLEEFSKMVEARNIKTDKAAIPLIKEFDNKWRTFAVIMEDYSKGLINPNGFVDMLKHTMPSGMEWYFIMKK